LTFDNKIITSNYNGFSFGSDSINTYPKIDPNDPVPALNRGYYFNSSSFLTSNQYFLGPDMSIAI
jgi:hypothetical protein